MTDQTRVPLARLWMRRSASGRESLVGRMGGARLLVFRNERKACDSDPDFELFAVAADDPPPSKLEGSRGPRPETRASELASVGKMPAAPEDPDLGPVVYLDRWGR